MRNDWKTAILEDCIDKVTYTKKVLQKDFLEVGKFPIISQEQEFINGYWNNIEDVFKVQKPIVVFGDHTKVLKYIDFDFVLGADGVKILCPKKEISTKYLYYFLLGVALENLGYARHFRILRDKEIRYPSLPEQQRIVASLDEAFTAIDQAKANVEKNLQNTRELFETYLHSIFANPDDDWEKCSLGEHIQFIDYRGKTPKKTSSGLRLITAKNVKNGYIQVDPQEFINPDIYESWMTRGLPVKGDVLFTTEAPLANIAQLDTDDKVAFAQRIIILHPEPDRLDSAFLKYMLLSKPIRQRIISNGTGATVLGIKASLLKRIGIYYPKEISDQNDIVSKLDVLAEATKKLEGIQQRKLSSLEDLKKSLLQKAFKGEL